MKHKITCLALLILCFLKGNAQIPTPSDTLMNQIFDLVLGTPKKDLISVMGTYEISDQIIRTDNLVFHDNGELVLTNLNVPYVVLAVKNLKFNAPLIRSKVRFGNYDINLLKGVAGTAGAKGTNGSGNGSKGGHGANGGTGGKGNTIRVPDIYILVENINTDYGDITTFDWQVIANGIQGGSGGQGGAGGSGGNGSRGRGSSNGPGHCRRGAQDGGKGGNGGQGGQGGEGGNGSDGAMVYLVGSQLVTDKLTYVQYVLNGGGSGVGGFAGTSGQGGSGGRGGSGSTFCSGGDRGGNGVTPNALGNGTSGQSGKNGEVKILIRNLGSVFP